MTKASSGAPAPPRSPTKAGSSPRARPRRNARVKSAPSPPETPGRARIIAIANQKGGVGKSTTAVSLGAALADLGYRILVVDLDPQGNASTGLGIRHGARDSTVYDVVVGDAPLDGAVIETQVKGLHAIPSTIDLAGAEIELVSQFSRESRLKKALEPVFEGVYDFIILDCPPSLGLLTVNALTAAEELIVPIQCEYYALEGLGQLLRNVNLVQQNINPRLQLTGIVMTMFDPRTRLSEQVVQEVRRFFGNLVYDVIIPRTVRLSEAPGFGQPITVYDPRSKGAETYRELAREVALRPRPDTPLPSIDDLATMVVAPEGFLPVEDIEAGDVGNISAEDALDAPPSAAQIAVGESSGSGSTETSAPPSPEDADATPPTPPQPGEVEGPPTEEPPVATVAAPEATDPVAEVPIDDDVWEEDEAADGPPRISSARVDLEGASERRVVVIDENASDAQGVRAPQPPAGDPGAVQDEAVTPIGATLEHEDVAPRRRWRLFRKGGD